MFEIAWFSVVRPKLRRWVSSATRLHEERLHRHAAFGVLVGRFQPPPVLVADLLDEQDQMDSVQAELDGVLGRPLQGFPVGEKVLEGLELQGVQAAPVAHEQVHLAVAGGKLGEDLPALVPEELLEIHVQVEVIDGFVNPQVRSPPGGVLEEPVPVLRQILLVEDQKAGNADFPLAQHAPELLHGIVQVIHRGEDAPREVVEQSLLDEGR